MKELTDRVEALLEEYDFRLCGAITECSSEKGQYNVELKTCSPLGEEVTVPLIYDGTEDGFINSFSNYANNFDPEEHAEMWINSRGKNGVPESIKDLLGDAKYIKDTLMRIAWDLRHMDNKEIPESMNREQFYGYIMENFNVSDDAARLIDNILQFVESKYPEENEQYCVLFSLLDGTIGLSDNEIKRVYM